MLHRPLETTPVLRHLSEKVRLAEILSGLLPSGLLIRTQGARTYSWAGWQVPTSLPGIPFLRHWTFGAIELLIFARSCTYFKTRYAELSTD